MYLKKRMKLDQARDGFLHAGMTSNQLRLATHEERMQVRQKIAGKKNVRRDKSEWQASNKRMRLKEGHWQAGWMYGRGEAR